jgi:hypothetical protein
VGSTWVATSPAAQPHANDAKATPGAATGFAYCQACHGTGTDFAGGSSGVSCYPCHSTTTSSPHASQWRTGDTYVHTTTAEGNAPVCAFCHLNGANSPVAPPSPPAPAGTAPGCFNSTLCHGVGGVPHPVGSAWVAASPAAQPHGDSAKATPGAAAGFAYCQVCHGTGTTPPANFGGGSSGVSCLTCHGNPHAPAPWRASAGSVYDHTSTDPGNAPICAQCHFPGSLSNPPNHPPSPAPAGTPPGCFNSTLCHGASFHPAGWAELSQHGTAAKAVPSASGGFSFCQTCHGTGTTPPANFGGGSVGVSCYPCHGNVGTPHPGTAGTWRGGATPTHRTTNQAQSNLDVCAQCHLNGANSPLAPPSPPAPAGTAPGCFNNTLCHN